MRILILEDDLFYLSRLSKIAEEFGLVHSTSNPTEAINLINNDHFDLLITDIDLKAKQNGLSVAKVAIKKEIDTFVLSSHDSEEFIYQAYKLGCKHFLQKKNFVQELPKYLVKFIKNKGLDLNKIFNEDFITQDSKTMEDVKNLLNSNLKNKTILITGETGVGKTELAKIIHQVVYTKSEPFIHLNCSEIAESLLESELFGHEKGAFTGADRKKEGKLSLANNGVLFLDEISSMSTGMQQKLLRAIEEKSFYPLGSTRSQNINFTLITATCDDLIDLMAQKKFRKDLFFRISGHNLVLSPLRERQHDIELLTKKFLNNSPRKIVLEEGAIESIRSYRWPGNVRELKKVIDLLANHTKGIITQDDFKAFSNDIYQETGTHKLLSHEQEGFILKHGLRSFIEHIEQEITKTVFTKNKGKVTHCIKDLKVSSSAFYRMLEKHTPA